jgi:quinol monooxygenase YgiN
MKGVQMTVTLGLVVTLEAKPGKEDEVAAFLLGGLSIVEGEPGTVTWYAIRHGKTTFGIFDTFGTEDGRQAHLSGDVAKALGEIAGDLLASPPDIRPVEVLAAKTAG